MSRRKKQSLLSTVVSAIVLAVLVVGFMYRDRLEPYFKPQPSAVSAQLELHMIDVEQGDSLLVRCGDKTMLVDAGEAEHGETVADYISSLGIKQLDYVVATHPHSDHIGGMPAVLESVAVAEFLMPDVTHETKTFLNMLDAVERAGCAAGIISSGDTFELGEAVVTVLSPDRGFSTADLNNYSVVLLVTFGGDSFLLTGDAEGEIEQSILPNLPSLTVLKAGHHGSNSSTTQQLVDKAKPKLALISAKLDNEYGHPHQEVITRLQNAQCEIYETSKHGNIIVTCKEGAVNVTTQK